MVKNKINSFQLSTLIPFLCTTSFLGIGFTKLFKLGYPEIFFLIIIGCIIGFLPQLMYLSISKYKPELNIIQKNKQLFGKIGGSIINVLLAIGLIILLIVLLYNFSTFINSQYLVETPIFIIALMFIVLSFFTASKDGEIITRLSIIILGCNVILLAISMLGLANYISIDNLKPFMTASPTKIIEYIFYFLAFFAFPPFLLSIFPKKQMVDPEKYDKMYKLFYLLSCIIIIIISFFIISILGIELLSIVEYPEYIVLQKINIFDFIERFENITSTQWVFSIFMTLTLGIYFLKNNIQDLFQLKKDKKSLFITAGICLFILYFATSIMPHYLFIQRFLIDNLPFIVCFTFFIIPLITFLTIKIKGNKSH